MITVEVFQQIANLAQDIWVVGSQLIAFSALVAAAWVSKPAEGLLARIRAVVDIFAANFGGATNAE